MLGLEEPARPRWGVDIAKAATTIVKVDANPIVQYSSASMIVITRSVTAGLAGSGEW